MKKFLPVILLLLCLDLSAQIPPAIQWQRSFGGSFDDGPGIYQSLIATADGGYIVCGSAASVDGDVTSNYGLSDAWVIKLDAGGNIQWKKNYGGSSIDYAYSIIQTTDGGYIFLGSTVSNDGNVSGNHGFTDVWLVKIDVNGLLQWQKCYGGSITDVGLMLVATPDGGYMIGATTTSSDGDVTGWHPGPPAPQLPPDVWLIKIDGAGNLQWQKCWGGTKGDDLGSLIVTADGGYFFTGKTSSVDGDVACTGSLNKVWGVKLDNSGNMQWQRCFEAGIERTIQTPDGGFFIAAYTFSPTVPGYHGSGDVDLIKIDAAGTTVWEKLLGGSNFELTADAKPAPGGGYILMVSTQSSDGDVCGNKGDYDVWIVKVDDMGNLIWQKTYGGSKGDYASNILPAADGSLLGVATSKSNDGDVPGNHGQYDFWLFKLDFPGIPVLPAVSIVADKTTICPGQPVRFIATPVDGGDAPFYQWQINGANTATNNDTVMISILNDGDIVQCLLTSNSRCVTSPGASSNSITITVDESMKPVNFLPIDTAVCKYGSIELKAAGVYNSYLWNTGATTPAIIISRAGNYWLDVTTSTGCPGSDTVLVDPKECLRGFYMPTAFTPNNDGKNDLLKPIIEGTALQYYFKIMNRWGQVIFETSDLSKGWDGRFKGIVQDGNAYVWTVSYQLAGEKPKLAKGTFVLIR